MPSNPKVGAPLSAREADVLRAFCDGCETQKEVARKLGISPRTVEIHTANAMLKLSARTQQRAVLTFDRAQRNAAVLAAVAVNLQRGNWAVIAPDGRSWALDDFETLVTHVRADVAGVPACPTCEGRGEVPTVEYADSMNGYPSAEPCPDCNGTGIAGVALPAARGAAVATLERLGYTYHGGELWKPPLGKRPAWLDAADGEAEYLSWVPAGAAVVDADTKVPPP